MNRRGQGHPARDEVRCRGADYSAVKGGKVPTEIFAKGEVTRPAGGKGNQGSLFLMGQQRRKVLPTAKKNTKADLRLMFL